MTLFVRHGRQYSGELGAHIVPRQMHPCMIFQIPVYSRGNADRVVAAYDHFLTLLVQLEEVAGRSHLFNDEFAGRTR